MTLLIILPDNFIRIYSNRHIASKTTGGVTLPSPENNRRRDFIKPQRQPEASLQLVPTIGGLIYHSNPRRQSEDIRHHLPLGPRRQPEASFIILIPVDNQRILDIIYHWDPEDNRRPHLSFKSPKTTGGLIYHSNIIIIKSLKTTRDVICHYIFEDKRRYQLAIQPHHHKPDGSQHQVSVDNQRHLYLPSL
ncbi:hypothetical protein H5410_019081 [Solanum commersonii]|uniref:Uncharacterized protein n=1 Tax=Solanum commersonii TaxID=4109 RepID=A0A9J6A3Z1_SOLCO|nr:hypothetical protein H5410_019081 [Solanum commersonii]